MKKHFIFTTLAMNQTEFFVGLIKEIEKRGHSASLITFHERSYDYAVEQGVKAFNIYRVIQKFPEVSDVEALFEQTCRDHGIENPRALLAHEKAAFNLSDDIELMKKYCGFTRGLEEIFDDSPKDVHTVVVQEVGGFLSLLSTFYVARKLELDHIFIEPSIFRGRLFFTKNTWQAPHFECSEQCEVSQDVLSYLEESRQNKKIVIPKKDVAQYKSIFKKLTTPRNYRRALEKSWDKHILKKQEEFSHIGHHISRHLQTALNYVQLKKLYTEMNASENFIYYPLHVPADMALTLRSPTYLDQYTLIDSICNNLPVGYKLYIKEHPAYVGALDTFRIRDLLKRHKSLRVIQPFTNNYELLGSARAIVTVNSKSGAEALMLQNHVIVLGDASYSNAPCAQYVKNIKDLPELVSTTIDKAPPSQEDVAQFFQHAWNNSYPGEIFVNTHENLVEFVTSLEQFHRDAFASGYSKMSSNTTITPLTQ